jgi:hypothetical protein
MVALFVWVTPSQELSIEERRKLNRFPEISTQSLLSGSFMQNFEEYAQDQFPYRFTFRSIKAFTRYFLFRQKENNNIYIQDGYAAKLEGSLNEDSIRNAAYKFQYLYEKYMEDSEVKAYLSIVPDKGYFLAEANGYVSMDYQELFEIMKRYTKFADYIDLTSVLEIHDYYRTDLHWQQEKLLKVAEVINDTLGGDADIAPSYRKVDTDTTFYGAYYGQAALPMEADPLVYLTNDMIESCTVNNTVTGETTVVYDMNKLTGKDPYDVFLSGNNAILVIDNPMAEMKKELVIFRDSFGSSLAPLLLEEYSKVTMIDIRYISSDLIGDYVTFDNQNVLFLYSTTVLNSSNMLK